MILVACRDARVPLCMNDRLDVAWVVEADAVHLGQDDLSPADARKALAWGGRSSRRPMAIGVSTHTLEQARAAAEDGADYIGVGPIFPTTTKSNPDPTVGLDELRRICGAVSVPVVAIGGITPELAPAVAMAGAAAAAVIGAVERAADPTAAGRLVAQAFGA
jgi:thiamine-phosphate pyrophosphorylase